MDNAIFMRMSVDTMSYVLVIEGEMLSAVYANPAHQNKSLTKVGKSR